jgi:hypothetical protein
VVDKPKKPSSKQKDLDAERKLKKHSTPDGNEEEKPKKNAPIKHEDFDEIEDADIKPTKFVPVKEEIDAADYDILKVVQTALRILLDDLVKFFVPDFRCTKLFKELAKKDSVSNDELKRYIMNDRRWHNAFYTYMTVNNRFRNQNWEFDFGIFQCASRLNEALQAKDDMEHFMILFDKAFVIEENGATRVVANLANYGHERDKILQFLRRYWRDKDNRQQVIPRSKTKDDRKSEKKGAIQVTSSAVGKSEKKVTIQETTSIGKSNTKGIASITITSPGRRSTDTHADLVTKVESAFHEMLDSLVLSTLHSFKETKAFNELHLKEEFDSRLDFGFFIIHDEKSSCYKAFRAFCKQQEKGNYLDRLECVVRLKKALKKKDDYVAFMTLFHDAHATVVLLVNDFDARKTLRECHDTYWDTDKDEAKPLS